MKRIALLPPQYFYLSILLIVLIRFIFPGFNLIYLPLNLIGILLIALGLVFIASAYRLFVKHHTPENFSFSVSVVTEGLYGYSRNPMYLGAIIFLTGFAILTQNILALISPAFFFFIMNFMFIPLEERKMECEQGQKYLGYKRQVRRWI